MVGIARTSLRAVSRASRVTVASRFYSQKPYNGEFGDYPKVQAEPAYFKNPYLKYDDQQGRRNYGDNIHPYNEMYDVWSPDRYNFVSDKSALKYFSAAVGVFGAFIAVMYMTVDHESPAVKRQFPFDGIYKALGGSEDTKEMYQARVDQGFGSKQ